RPRVARLPGPARAPRSPARAPRGGRLRPGVPHAFAGRVAARPPGHGAGVPILPRPQGMAAAGARPVVRRLADRLCRRRATPDRGVAGDVRDTVSRPARAPSWDELPPSRPPAAPGHARLRARGALRLVPDDAGGRPRPARPRLP